MDTFTKKGFMRAVEERRDRERTEGLLEQAKRDAEFYTTPRYVPTGSKQGVPVPKEKLMAIYERMKSDLEPRKHTAVHGVLPMTLHRYAVNFGVSRDTAKRVFEALCDGREPEVAERRVVKEARQRRAGEVQAAEHPDCFGWCSDATPCKQGACPRGGNHGEA